MYGDLPDYLVLKIQAPGYMLLRQKIGKIINPISFDIRQNVPEYLLKQDGPVFVLTANIRDQIEMQMNQDVKLVDISPDTLTFRFVDKSVRLLPVLPQLKYVLGQQMVLKSPVSSKPKIIQVSGPGIIVDTMHAVYTEIADLGILNESQKLKLKLIPIKGVTYSEKNVSLQLDVEKFTENSFTVPVFIENAPDSHSFSVLPAQVTVTCCMGLSRYKSVDPSQFVIAIDYNEIYNSKSNRFSIMLKRAPDYVFNIRMNPRSVELLITK
jgi:hypothetical protein